MLDSSLALICHFLYLTPFLTLLIFSDVFYMLPFIFWACSPYQLLLSLLISPILPLVDFSCFCTIISRKSGYHDCIWLDMGGGCVFALKLFLKIFRFLLFKSDWTYKGVKGLNDKVSCSARRLSSFICDKCVCDGCKIYVPVARISQPQGSVQPVGWIPTMISQS